MPLRSQRERRVGSNPAPRFGQCMRIYSNNAVIGNDDLPAVRWVMPSGWIVSRARRLDRSFFTKYSLCRDLSRKLMQ
jgi:hypothetical protein